MNMYFVNLFVGLFQIYLVIRNGIRKSTLLGLYILSFTMLNILGSFYIYFPDTSPYILSKNYASSTFFIVLILHQFVLLISWLLCSSNKLYSVPDIVLSDGKNSIRPLFILVCIILGLVGLDIVRNGLPIFYSNFGAELSNTDFVKLRSEYFDHNGSFFLNSLGYYIAPLFLGVILLLRVLKKPTLSRKLIMTFGLVIGAALSLSFFHKTPLLIFAASLFFVYSLSVKMDKKRVLRRLFYFTLINSVLLLAQYYLVFSNQVIYSYSDIFNAILNRLIGVYPLGLAVAIDVQESTGFLWGRTFPNMLGLHPQSFDLSSAIHWQLFALKGNAPAPFIGYAYINFGLVGVMVMSIVSVVILRVLDIYIINIKNIYFKACLLALLFQKVLYMAMSSLFDNILNPRDIFLYIVLLTILYLKFYESRSAHL